MFSSAILAVSLVYFELDCVLKVKLQNITGGRGGGGGREREREREREIPGQIISTFGCVLFIDLFISGAL